MQGSIIILRDIRMNFFAQSNVKRRVLYEVAWGFNAKRNPQQHPGSQIFKIFVSVAW
jgi:hypothetical protein